MYLRPRELKTLLPQSSLQILNQFLTRVDGSRRLLDPDRLGSYCPRCFANIPFHRMQAVAAVGDVRGTDIFTSGKEIFDPDGNQRA